MSDEQRNVSPGGGARPNPAAMTTSGPARPAARPVQGQPPARPGPAPRQSVLRPGGAAAPQPKEPKGPELRRERRGRLARFAVDYIMPFTAGLALTVAVYGLLVRNLPWAGTWGAVREALAFRGPVPHLLTMLLFWHLSHLLVRFFARVRPEFGMLEAGLIPASGTELTPAAIGEMARRTTAAEADHGPRILTRRLRMAVDHLSIRYDNVELGDLLRHSDDADRERIRAAYALPTLIFWAIPLLGLAGAVHGMSTALAAGEASIAAALGVAAETVMMALVATMVTLLVQTLVRHSEWRLLAEVQDYLTRHLQARVRSETEVSRMHDMLGSILQRSTELQEVIRRNQEELVAENANVRANLESSIGSMSKTLGGEFREMTAELADSLKQVTARLAVVFEEGKQLGELQAQLQRNIEELNKIHDIGETFSEMRSTLARLIPVLDSLNKPIPLRFTLDAGEVEVGTDLVGEL